MNIGSLLGIILKQYRNNKLVGFIDSYLKDGLGEHAIIFFSFCTDSICSSEEFITAWRHLKLIFLEDLDPQSTCC